MSATPQTNRASGYPQALGQAELLEFIELADKLTGIQLDVSKESLLFTRLSRRLRALKMPTFDLYLALLKSGDPAEVEEFVNVVTTNLTYFFREPHHFKTLADSVLPDLQGSKSRHGVLRIWSSACSSGEEPYSIAMTLAESGLAAGSDYRILCTDLNTEMVELTRRGDFLAKDARGLDEARKSRFFAEDTGGVLKVNQELRDAMICKSLNLFNDWPIRSGVDIIFCRNVLIYFNAQQHTEIVLKFAKVQAAGAYLFLGHSETVHHVGQYYERVGNTVFKRTARQVD